MEAKTDRAIKICQVGAGLIGKERINALLELKKLGKNLDLCLVYDPGLKEKPELLKKAGINLTASVEDVFSAKPDWVFIATPHDVAVEHAKIFLSRGFNVLVEKPLGRNLEETRNVLAAQVRENQLFVGCNYRFYEGINAALVDVRRKAFGNIISVNMVLGHGGSPQDKTSWKLDPEKAGGGVLIDPGIHLLDLCECMFGEELEVKDVVSWRGFWNTGIEEESHALLKSGSSVINLQLSVARWRSTFRIEINGDEAYGIVEGRGRSYGKQRYMRGKRWGWQSGKSQKETEELVVETDGDRVFQNEITALLFGAQINGIGPCNGREAAASMKLLDDCRKRMGDF